MGCQQLLHSWRAGCQPHELQLAALLPFSSRVCFECRTPLAFSWAAWRAMLPNNPYGGLSKPSSSWEAYRICYRTHITGCQPHNQARFKVPSFSAEFGACRSRKRFNWMISFQVRRKVGKRKVGGNSVRRKGGKSVRRKGGKSGCG